MLGISTQVPRVIYIKSNRTDKKIKYSHFVIEPDKDYRSGDFKYVQLAEMLKYQDRAEYTVDGKIDQLKKVCIYNQKLERYKEMA